MAVLLAKVDAGDWPRWERLAIEIALQHGASLTNSTGGGEGVPELDAETRRRMGAAISVANARPEVKAAQSQAMRDYWADPERRKNLLEKFAAPESRAKRVAANARNAIQKSQQSKAWWASKSAEEKAEIAKNSKAKWESPEFREKTSRSIKDALSRDDVRARHLAGLEAARSRPGVKESMAESVRAAWVRRKAAMATTGVT